MNEPAPRTCVVCGTPVGYVLNDRNDLMYEQVQMWNDRLVEVELITGRRVTGRHAEDVLTGDSLTLLTDEDGAGYNEVKIKLDAIVAITTRYAWRKQEDEDYATSELVDITEPRSNPQ